MSNRSGKSVWDALDYAVQNKVAAFISTSYGYCEGGERVRAEWVRLLLIKCQRWAQQANSQGQTIVSASGDERCRGLRRSGTSATQGLAVDVPASIPEVTGMGGNEFTGDSPISRRPIRRALIRHTGPRPALAPTPFLRHWNIFRKIAWNETPSVGTLRPRAVAPASSSRSPHGRRELAFQPTASAMFRISSIAASPNHDGYLVCSEDGNNGAIQPSCAFRLS